MHSTLISLPGFRQGLPSAPKTKTDDSKMTCMCVFISGCQQQKEPPPINPAQSTPNGNIESNKRSLGGLSGLFLSPGDGCRVSAFVFDK